jgi:uncharacterized protein YueI
MNFIIIITLTFLAILATFHLHLNSRIDTSANARIADSAAAAEARADMVSNEEAAFDMDFVLARDKADADLIKAQEHIMSGGPRCFFHRQSKWQVVRP